MRGGKQEGEGWVDFERNYQLIEIGSGAQTGLGRPWTTWPAEDKELQGTNNNLESLLVILLVRQPSQMVVVVPRLRMASTRDWTAA